MTQNVQIQLTVMIPHLQSTASDINQTFLSVCEGIIFSSSVGGTDQFENAQSSIRLHCIQDKWQWKAALEECSDFYWIPVVLMMTMSRSVYLSIKIRLTQKSIGEPSHW